MTAAVIGVGEYWDYARPVVSAKSGAMGKGIDLAVVGVALSACWDHFGLLGMSVWSDRLSGAGKAAAVSSDRRLLLAEDDPEGVLLHSA